MFSFSAGFFNREKNADGIRRQRGHDRRISTKQQSANRYPQVFFNVLSVQSEA